MQTWRMKKFSSEVSNQKELFSFYCGRFTFFFHQVSALKNTFDTVWPSDAIGRDKYTLIWTRSITCPPYLKVYACVYVLTCERLKF